MFYFEQVSVFCMLINKNVLEWFLLMVCKEHTLLRSTKLISRNHPKVYFRLIREGRQMPKAEQLLYQTDKTSHRGCPLEKSVLKHFAIFTGKHLCWSLFISFIKKRLKHRCFTATKFLRTPWRTSVFGYFWTDFREWLFGTLFLDSRFQNQRGSVILQKYQSPSNHSFKHNLVHMSPLYLTPTLPFESKCL